MSMYYYYLLFVLTFVYLSTGQRGELQFVNSSLNRYYVLRIGWCTIISTISDESIGIIRSTLITQLR